MAEQIVKVSLLPEGWNTFIDRNGKEQRTRLAFEVGDLSVLLKKALKQRWRFNLLTKKIELDGVTVPVAEIDQLYVALSEHGYKIDQSQGRSGKKRRWRPSGTSRRRTPPEAGQTPASDSDAGEASQVSTPFHQKDLNQGEPVAAAATVGKTPERSERRRHRIPQLEFPDAPFFGRPSPNTGDGFAPTKSDRQRISRSS